MSKLTPERIEAAINYLKGLIVYAKSWERKYPEYEQFPDGVETALAALEAVMGCGNDQHPNNQQRVLIKFGSALFDAYYDEDTNDAMLPDDFIHWMDVDRWWPLEVGVENDNNHEAN